VLAPSASKKPGRPISRSVASPQAVAHELFAVLRDLDAALAEQGGGEIWVEEPPQGAEWDGVRDRLSRAAA
jgi:L-threonylcarbamoyladenylate synthase